MIGNRQLFNNLILLWHYLSLRGAYSIALRKASEHVTLKTNCVESLRLAGLVLLATAGCGPSIRSVGTFEKFQGQAINVDGKPLSNVLVILQPTERGYEIELEVDSDGKFSGEGIPGKYIFYFAESKSGKHKLPKGFLPSNYLEPKLEHVISVQAKEEITCKVE